MNLLQKTKRIFTDADYRWLLLAGKGMCDKLDDKQFIEKKFKAVMGYDLNLNNPKTFNEKLQWMKLYDRNPLYTTLADKYAVRNYVKEVLGEEYLIPLLGVWDNPDEIDFDQLPNQFVLKCNHNSGIGMCICKDKTKLDISKVKKELRKGLNQDYYLAHREWPYKDIERKIICEKFMIDGDQPIKDYKFQIFNGKIAHVFVCVGRDIYGNARFYYFDENWDDLKYSKDVDYELDKDELNPPENFEEMKEVALKLAGDLQEVRIDLYTINGKIYFGEYTFFDNAGWDTNITDVADIEIGNKWDLK